MVELGLVDAVRVENSEVRVDVFMGAGRMARDVTFVSPMQGMWIVPEMDQVVEVYEDAREERAARFPRSVPDHSPPSSLGPGDLAITLNAGTHITFLKQSNGTYNVDIAADGDVTIDGIDFDQHTHDYVDELSDGSTATKTTDPPQ